MKCRILRLFLMAALMVSFKSSPAQHDQLNPGNGIITPGTTDDTAIVTTVFTAEPDSFEKWKKAPDFAYMEYLDSLLKQNTLVHTDTVSLNQASVKNQKGVTSPDETGSILNSFPARIFFWSAAVFFIGFIVYTIFFKGNFFIKRNLKTVTASAEEANAELREAAAYDELIHQAERQRDYNLSTRYLYLQTLRRLADKNLIGYAPEKTNYHYVHELSGSRYLNDFEFLTRSYEYAWYGKFVLENPFYDELKKRFTSFNQQL